MSKKVLNYAGKRPMLLALIMTVIGFVLLFSSSGPLPSTTQAQQSGTNSPPSNENTNCPNYTTNVVVSCPTVNTYGTINPTSFCVNQGSELPDPTYVSGTSTDGGKVTTITETCANTATTSSGGITYSFFWYYSPPKPTGKPAPGTYQSTAIEYCSSSDTNDCPSPGEHSMGTVTWNVINTNATISSSSIDFSTIAGGLAAFAEEVPVGWSCSKKPQVTLENQISTSHLCCNDGSVGTKTAVEGKTAVSFNCSGSTPSYPVPITLGIVQVRMLCGFKVSASASDNSDATTCPDEPRSHTCIIPAASVSIFGGIGISVFSTSCLDVTGTVQGGGSLIGGQYCFYNDDLSYDSVDSLPWQFCYNNVTLNGTITLVSLIDYSVGMVVVNGNCP